MTSESVPHGRHVDEQFWGPLRAVRSLLDRGFVSDYRQPPPGDALYMDCPLDAGHTVTVTEPRVDHAEFWCDHGCDEESIRARLFEAQAVADALDRDVHSSAEHGQGGSLARAELRVVDGATFALDATDDVPAVWGEGHSVAWPEGEPAILVGPQGVGKTTVAQQLTLKRIGIGSADLLDMPVAVDPKKVLYIAADRPRQAARSLGRMVTEEDRELLSERLVVWTGPLPFDIALEPERLATFVADLGAGTVIIDSLKDVARDLSKDETGSRVNLALQHTVAAGIEALADHHQRKEGSDGKKPRRLDDVYGSTWITAGAGSVLLLWGEPGDPIVDLLHLKQPAEEVGPLKVRHDHEHGRTGVYESGDLFDLIQRSCNGGVTAAEGARHLFGASEPSANEREKARRRLEGLVKAHRIGRIDGSPSAPTRYVPLDLRREA